MKTILKFSFCILILLLFAGCATPLPLPEEVVPPEDVEPVPVIIPVEPPPVEIPPEEPQVVIPPEPEPAVEIDPEPIIEPVPEPVIEQVILIITNGPLKDFPGIASLYKEASIFSPTLLIDRGGSLASYPEADIDEGEGIITLMNAIPYEATVLGTEDFFHDSLRLRQLLDSASFPVISTNVSGSSSLQRSAVIQTGGISVAILSFIPQEHLDKLHPSLTAGFTAAEPVQEISAELNMLSGKGIDLIILLSPVNVLQIPVSDELIPEAVSILDAVSLIIQDEHTTLVDPYIIGAESLATKIILSLENRVITSIESESIDVSSLQPDSYILSLSDGVNQSRKLIINRAEDYLIDGSVDRADRFGMFPLMNALQFGEPPTVIGALLSKGASVSQSDDFGMTPLMYASWLNNDPRIITRLIREGSSPDERDAEGWTSLMRSALNENTEVMETLISSGADINAVNTEGWTALMFAAGFAEDPQFTRLLLEFGADIDMQSDEGMTALMYAAGFSTNPEIISLLLDYGADVSVRDEFGTSAVEYARDNRNIKDTGVMQRLMEAASP